MNQPPESDAPRDTVAAAPARPDDAAQAREPARGQASERPRRSRARPWLLLLLLAALIGLLAQRPAMRADALVFTRHAVMDGLNISPRALYALRLRVAGLEDSALGRRWRSAVTRAGAEPRRFTTRYATDDGFAADQIEAHVYQTTLARGERLDIRLRREPSCADCRSALYTSLEYRAADGANPAGWTTVATVDASARTESHLAGRDGDYRVVLQPELAAEVNYEIGMARGGSLSFPVQGGGTRDIGSGFGAPRDAGSRAHHGVDIFADRGTPVRAVADGRVRTGSGGIGGNHVWLSSCMLGVTGVTGARYYYAHLDDFAVDSGARVETGDILGFVGNTGNARTTPPHLHFGIYTGSGPVNPAPFLEPPPRLPSG